MSLVQDYCVTYDKGKNYILTFNTTEAANVAYSTEKDGTNVITVTTDKKGKTAFTNTYTSKDGAFKYVFSQPGTTDRIRVPSGAMIP
jgi:hypothetical protein